MKIKIEPIKKENVLTLLALLREFAEFEKLDCEATEIQLETAFFGASAIAEAILVHLGDQVVGFSIFYPIFSSFRGQLGFHLEDIYVKPENRGQNIGVSMLKYLAKLADSRGFERIDFQVLTWNQPAIKFYKKFGAVIDDTERHYKFTDQAFRDLAN